MALLFRVEELRRDDPLVAAVAVLRRDEWGAEESSASAAEWESVTRAECQSDDSADSDDDGLPFTLAAKDSNGVVVGAVGLVRHDPEGLGDRCPWVVGTVVRPDTRSFGVGTALMAELHERARRFETLWVSTQKAAGFYARCGYEPVAGHPTILRRRPVR
jgi:predicted N-acetyltransferase YhbS